MTVGSAKFGRGGCLGAMLAVAVLAGGGAAAAESSLVEGFEDISKVKVAGGKLTAATGGGGVTEGKQAARVPPKTSLILTIPAADCRRYAWLKLDTLTLQPLAHRFHIEAKGKRLSFARYCYVQPGKDTLALPLSWLVAHVGGRWPEGNVRVTLTSAGDAAVIVDNVRLAPADPAPEGCVLQDFGAGKQLVWPGFEGAEAESEHVVWSGETTIVAYANWSFPDPLSADFVGPRLRNGPTRDNFSLVCPGRAGKAWLWVTHFTGRGPPAEYAVKLRGKTVLRTKRSQRQMLGPKGLFEGKGGDWTPEWYDKTYARHFVDIVKINLVAGRNRIDLGNCQLAALAMAPAPKAARLAKYIDKVLADLSRFRRQFIVGARIGARCELAATEADEKAHVMVFAPPLDDALAPGWKPEEGHRAKVFRAVVANGDAVTIAIAVAPLKATSFLSAALGSLRTEDGRQLPTDRGRTGVWFCQRIPRVLDAAAQFQPWILTRRCGRLAERDLACILLTVGPTRDAAGGLYKGALGLTLAGRKTRIPLEVRVVDIGPETKAQPTMGAMWADGRVPGFYLSLGDWLSDAAKDALSRKVREQLLSDALNSLHLRAADLTPKLVVSDAWVRRDIKAFPVQLATGPTLFNLGGAFYRLTKMRLGPGTRKYQAAVTGAVRKTTLLARRAGFEAYYFDVGNAHTAKELADISRRASSVRSAGGPAIAWVSLAAIRQTPEKDRRRVLLPFASLVLKPDRSNLGQSVKFFKSLGKGKKAYVYLARPNRYGAGLFAAASGADGSYAYGVASKHPLYNGFLFDGSGVLALQPDKSLAPTLAMFALRQGVRDFLLVKRCEALVAAAEKAGAGAPGLKKALAELRARVARDARLAFRPRLARSSRMAPSEIRTWRVRLITEAGKAAQALKAK